MNSAQMTTAQLMLTTWLAHPSELGRIPAAISCMGEFDLHGLRYYIFRYRKYPLGRWLVGVSGGFAGDSREHAGHVFSHKKPYMAATAEADCKAMVELVRAYRSSR